MALKSAVPAKCVLDDGSANNNHQFYTTSNSWSSRLRGVPPLTSSTDRFTTSYSCPFYKMNSGYQAHQYHLTITQILIEKCDCTENSGYSTYMLNKRCPASIDADANSKWGPRRTDVVSFKMCTKVLRQRCCCSSTACTFERSYIR
jgi:hypothetical protein